MADDSIMVPEHYKVLAAALRKVVGVIEQAFVNRPVPEGPEWEDLPEALGPLFERQAAGMQRLTTILNELPACLPADSGKDRIMEAVREVDREIRNMIDLFHSIWRKPFPRDFAASQPLASAVIEDPLRNCHELFQKVIDVTEMPPEKIVETFGGKTVVLNVTFSDQPALRLRRWLSSNEKELRCKTAAIQTARADKSAAWLLGILFGWWIGRKD